MRRLIAILLLGLGLAGCASNGSGQDAIKTTSSMVAGATVTMVHFGANW